ncbi:MAG: BMP family ABC transporter substrate-binding protein [Polyangiaceae bacterium]|nr:BMP family ABC transporter substrate-binding protein [Polyangiaceae bacterium]
MRRQTVLRTVTTPLLGVWLVAFASSSCSVITDSDIAAGGIGQACSSDDDCQGASCDQGACVVTCSGDGDCPARSRCWGGRCFAGTVVGEACSNNADCQGALCADGICVTACSDGSGTTECPGNSECFNRTCQNRLKVAGVWIGLAASTEGWTLTHHEGVLASQEKLGYVDYVYDEALLGPDAEKAIDKFVAEGTQVIIANSFDYVSIVHKKSDEYPNTAFLLCSGLPREPNVASYFAHLEQAWYVAGRVAARKTLRNHLGFIGSFANAEVIRHINAFTLGARSEKPDINVEVRWLGFWYDVAFNETLFEYTALHLGEDATKKRLTGEEYLTAKLIDSGADVITHNLDNQLTSRYIGLHTVAGTLRDPQNTSGNFTVWSIANDNRYGWRDQSGQPYVNAIGSVYWNWEPLYTTMFEAIHHRTLQAINYQTPLLADTARSVVGFGLSAAETGITTLTVDKLLQEAEDMKPEGVFRGPISQTGQRKAGDIPEGVAISEDEWRTMCWYVDGVKERLNPNDPTSDLVDALVPSAEHPGKIGDQKEPSEPTKRQPTTAPEMLVDLGTNGAIWDCNANSRGPN